ncbi:MAG: hypothetical protein ACYDD5_11150 [Sulfuricurvum sp.]
MQKNIPIEISKYFDYQKDELLGNLIYTAIFVFRSAIDKHENLINEVLKLSGIDRPAPLFMRLLEEIYFDIVKQQNKGVLQQTMKHAPNVIQHSPLTWAYYALYWYWPQNASFEEMKSKMPENLAKILFQFHFDLLIYKQKESIESTDRRDDKFYHDVARGVTRGVELLSGLYIQKDTLLNKDDKEYLEEVYFNKNDDDWLFNFYNVLENDLIEANSFRIQDGGTSSFYISYDSISHNIGEWHFRTSRKTQAGKTRQKGVNNNLRHYMLSYRENHEKMRGLIYKDKPSQGSGGKRSKKISQYTVVEPFNRSLSINLDIPVEPSTREEAIEQKNNETKRTRAYPDTALGERDAIPNAAQQRNRNKAFSAKITKRSLLLKTDYEVPPKEHLKEFIKYVFSNKMNDAFNREDFFKSVFLTSLITGYDYHRTVTGIFLQTNNMAEYKEKTNEIAIGIDPGLFSKEKKSDYLVYGIKDIVYRLPYLYGMLWSRQKSQILALDEEEIAQLTSQKWANEYIGFMVSLQKTFQKKIKINFKHIWRIIATYRREQSIEDMSVLFCVGKYQSCDESRLAYASTLKRSETFSEMMEKMYIDLDLHESVCKLLGISRELFRPALSITVKPEYAGTSRVLEIQKSIQFFNDMNRLVRLQISPVAEFNILSIALRFALSITLGTRTFSKSDSFEFMSMHTIRISEKAETISAGTRIIPVCDIAENLIERYRKMALDLGFEVTQVMFIVDGKLESYSDKKALHFLDSYGAPKHVQQFVIQVPLNTGRHIITKYAIEHNFNSFYLEALLGHYISGGEQEGIFSTMNMREYISSTREMLQHIAQIYGVDKL